MNRDFKMGISCGYSQLDAITEGMKPGELILVAGRPGMGKTSFTVNIAHNLAQSGLKTFIFSLEMSACTIQDKYSFVNSNLGNEDLIYITDTANIPVSYIKEHLSKLDSLQIDLIIVDYLQLLRCPLKVANERKIVVSEIVREMKQLANETGIPFLVTSQLSRKCEYRENHRPNISDFESVTAEDWDTILFLYRDDYYHRDEDNPKYKETTKSLMEIMIAKHPKAKPESIMLHWNPNTLKLSDIE